MDAPLGAVMLALLGLGVLAALISGAMLRSQMQVTENRYSRDLQAQRELADKAEASRFTELREYLDFHFREDQQRGAVASSEFERSMLQGQRDLRAQLDQLSRSLDLRLGQLEGRIEARMEHLGPAPELERRAGPRRAEDDRAMGSASTEAVLSPSTAPDRPVR
jgi:hypothetical protein